MLKRNFIPMAILAVCSQTAMATNADSVQYDLTGYWKYGDNRILYLTQDGPKLTSHHTKQTPDYAHFADELDFTATVLGDLVHGAHLIRLPWPMHGKCPLDMWVGIGLTINDDQTVMTGFRGHRTVDLVTCEVSNGSTRSFVYHRMLDAEGNPLK